MARTPTVVIKTHETSQDIRQTRRELRKQGIPKGDRQGTQVGRRADRHGSEESLPPAPPVTRAAAAGGRTAASAGFAAASCAASPAVFLGGQRYGTTWLAGQEWGSDTLPAVSGFRRPSMSGRGSKGYFWWPSIEIRPR